MHIERNAKFTAIWILRQEAEQGGKLHFELSIEVFSR